MILTDKEIIESQKGVVKKILSDLMKNWSFKDGLVSFSLPAKIFSHFTQMHLIPQLFSNIQYLYDAYNCIKNNNNTFSGTSVQFLKRLKILLVYFIKGIYQGCQAKKPYNPYIGETLQAYFGDGTEIFIEHTNHNPPIDSFYIHNKKMNIKIYGSFSLIGKKTYIYIFSHYLTL